MRTLDWRMAAGVAVFMGATIASSAHADFVVDGVNNFAPGDTYSTSDAGYTGYVALNGSALHFGYTGADIQTGGPQHFVVAYIGGAGSSSTTGILFNTQQPALPFAATHALVYRADGGYTQFFASNGVAWQPVASTGGVAESGNFFEAGLPLVDLGSPGLTVQFLSYLLFEGAFSESSYAAVPNDAFANGTYDPNPSTFLTLTIPEPATLGLLAPLLTLTLRRRRGM